MKRSAITILVVDDEEVLAETIQSFFEMRGFHADLALGGHEALGKIKNKKYDFILSDVRMPQGDGINLLKGIRALSGPQPLVFLYSGQIDKEGAHSSAEILSLGADAFLDKPFDIDALMTDVEKRLNIEED